MPAIAAAVQIGNSRFAWRASSVDVATVQPIVTAIAPAAMTVSQAIGTASGEASEGDPLEPEERADPGQRRAPVSLARRTRPRAPPKATATMSEMTPSGM